MKRILYALLALCMILSLAACQKEETKTIDLNTLHPEIKNAYGDSYLPAAPMEGTDLNARYGLTSDMYTEIIAEFPMMQYPMNVPKIQASQVISHGDYIFFVMLSFMDETDTSNEVTSEEDIAAAEEEALKKAQEDNQTAIDIINRYFE